MNSERTIQSLNQVPLFNLFDSREGVFGGASKGAIFPHGRVDRG